MHAKLGDEAPHLHSQLQQLHVHLYDALQVALHDGRQRLVLLRRCATQRAALLTRSFGSIQRVVHMQQKRYKQEYKYTYTWM